MLIMSTELCGVRIERRLTASSSFLPAQIGSMVTAAGARGISS